MNPNVTEVKSVRRFKCGYELRNEIWGLEGTEPTEMVAAYSPSGEWIGSSKTAHRLVAKRGIQPQKSSPNHCVCSIGYSIKDGKWYGWSHRAIYGFKVGSTCKKGDCHYSPSKGEWTARTTADAKQMAIDFAESVS